MSQDSSVPPSEYFWCLSWRDRLLERLLHWLGPRWVPEEETVGDVVADPRSGPSIELAIRLIAEGAEPRLAASMYGVDLTADEIASGLAARGRQASLAAAK